MKPSTLHSEASVIRTYNLCFVGFGNVNRTLVQLLENRAAQLRELYGISYRITGIASRRLGWVADPDGLDLTGLALKRAESAIQNRAIRASDVRAWLTAACADIVFEATSLNLETGQPAI